MPQQTEKDTAERRRIDLSVTQVAASALAAVVGAVLASELGVYGTILGAAVVSIGATTGGAVFQHVFRRTGEQLRSAVERTDGPDLPAPKPAVGLTADWNEPQLVRAKRRWTWKSYAVVSGLVFVLAMAPIVVVELAAGKPMHDITTGGGGSGTSFNPGGGDKHRQSPADAPPPSSGSTDPASVPAAPPSGTPSSSPSAHPSTSPSPSASASPSSTPTTGQPSPPEPAPPTGSASPSPTPSATAAP